MVLMLTLEMHSGTAPLFDDTSMPEPWRVAIQETVVIPASHEMVVPTSMVSQTARRPVTPRGLTEGRWGFSERSQIIVARTLVNPASVQMPVRVVNSTRRVLKQSTSRHKLDVFTVRRNKGVTIKSILWLDKKSQDECV